MLKKVNWTNVLVFGDMKAFSQDQLLTFQPVLGHGVSEC